MDSSCESEDYDFSDIDKYFDPCKWEKMSDYEKERYLKMYQNYFNMIKSGFDNAPKPDFMTKPIELSDNNVSDEEKLEVPIKKPRIATRKSRISVGDQAGTSGVSEPVRRYPKRNVAKKNYREEEIIPDDRYVYCDDCLEEWVDYCKIHGDLIIIKDENVPQDSEDPERAIKTTPKGWMTVKQSKISGLGVWSRRNIPEAIRFGPYEGEITYEANDEGYCWELRENGRQKKCIDAYNPGLSNWMRYVNCARNKEEQNLMAYQYCGQMYYRTLYEILPHTELLVWYGTKFAKELGIDCKTYNAPLEKPLPATVFQCNDCHNDFNSPIKLEEHVQRCTMKEVSKKVIIHADSGIFECRYCENCYSTLEFCQRHMKWCNKNRDYESSNVSENHVGKTKKYRGERQFKCDKCEKSFTYKNGLNAHKKIHSGDNLHICHFCDRKCLSKSDLTAHVRTHTQEKPFQCDQCKKTFSQLVHLTGHMRTHTGERPYQCEQCDQRFTQSGPLAVHRRTHSGEKPFSCHLCDRAFSRAGNLTRHLKTHSGDKPHLCHICDKRFIQSSQLTSHMRTHTGEKPFVCKFCNEKFARIYTLKHHINREHSK